MHRENALAEARSKMRMPFAAATGLGRVSSGVMLALRLPFFARAA